MSTKLHATIDDLYRLPHVKAEIVNGEVVTMSPTGLAPSYAAGEIFVSLRNYSRRTKSGLAILGNAAFRVELPNRSSFSPDAGYYLGPWTGMKFYEGAPVFAVEVRSEGDYGPGAERSRALKRADYFAAGTKVVWDVDLLSEDVVNCYTAEGSSEPRIFRRGEIADAEPAVRGWSMPVDDLFAEQF
ncbi:MAG TPA: Uma2 family endonuclease [Pyrinomonadaceae bacterium]|jgi:Uma2 family endonuclease|nr:Uma2 family endonuclease [Pyrinomonadaceae bacterium]